MYKKNITDIEHLISNYFEGIFYGDTAKLESCFHKHTHIYGDIKDVDYFKSKKEYLEGG